MEIVINTEKKEHMGFISELMDKLKYENISKIELNHSVHSDGQYFLYVFVKDYVYLGLIHELVEMTGDDDPIINMELKYVMFSVEK